MNITEKLNVVEYCCLDVYCGDTKLFSFHKGNVNELLLDNILVKDNKFYKIVKIIRKIGYNNTCSCNMVSAALIIVNPIEESLIL